jgi:dipeptidyl aminopeptidase/acylaminoacyl peptidase
MLLFAALFCASAQAQSIPAKKHPFGLDDMQIHSALPVDVSPDGKQILYQVSYDGTSGPTKHEWHLMDLDGTNARKLKLPEHFEPIGFMKDGQALYGKLDVQEDGQLAIVPLAEGKLIQILALPRGTNEAHISPDGQRFAVLADPRPEDELKKVRTVVENEQTSLYVVGIHGEDAAWWCPDLKNVGDIAWSADSTKIAVLSATPRIGYHDIRSFIDVCSATGKRHVADIPNSASGIAWTNSGQELAFSSTTTQVLTPDHLWTVPETGGTPVDRTPGLEGTVLGVKPDPRGTVWVNMERGLLLEVDSYRDGKLQTGYAWPNGTVFMPVLPAFATSPETLAFGVSDSAHSTNVAVAGTAGLERITHEGDDLLAGVSLGDVRVVDWKAKDGTKLQGVVTFPADYEAGQGYRFVNFPHGGPEGSDLLNFDLFARMLAGMGYVVMQPEYRGSTGYGSEFMNAIYQHFGDTAYTDVDSATDFAIAQGWADPNRLAMFGWSAGGFMTAWTVTQTHRYRAAIEGAGITDWLSFIPTSDIAQADFDARLQEKDAAPFLRFSAVMFADQVTTPLLILHGENDRRVPTFQGREFFVLLAERGKTVRMVTYPGSPHFPRLAEQRRNVSEEIIGWLSKYNP